MWPVILSIIFVLLVIGYFCRCWDALAIFALGGLAGYFLALWIHIVLIIIAVLYYFKKQSGNDGDTIRFFIITSFVIGLVVGNLFYFVPMLHIAIDFNPAISKSWFLR